MNDIKNTVCCKFLLKFFICSKIPPFSQGLFIQNTCQLKAYLSRKDSVIFMLKDYQLIIFNQ